MFRIPGSLPALIVSAVVLSTATVAPAQVSTSASFSMRSPSIAAPGGAAGSSSFRIHACLTDAGGGEATSSGFRLQSGCGASFLLGLDYGDAPDPGYPSSRANDGARHLLASTLRLGGGVDAELDAQLGGDQDDDGVTFLTDLVPGANAMVRVSVSRAGGHLDAWIDFDGDEDWEDAGEQIFAAEPLPNVAPAVNDLTFAVPAGALTNATSVARFRVSTTGGLGPTGFAPDGEVEDYEVSTVPIELFSFGVE